MFFDMVEVSRKPCHLPGNVPRPIVDQLTISFSVEPFEDFTKGYKLSLLDLTRWCLLLGHWCFLGYKR